MKRILIPVLPMALFSACGNADDAYDPALLEAYLAAIPSAETLEMTVPEASTAQKQLTAVGDPAYFPQQAVPAAKNVNDMIRSMLDTIDTLTAYPPTLYNSETREFMWGPIDNGGTELEGDSVFFFIQDQGEDADLRYAFRFYRAMGSDTSTFMPIIFGAQTPDSSHPDYGEGATLWDFDANTAFEDLYHPDHAPMASGKFASIFRRGLDAEAKDVTWVVAAFRDFLGDDAAEGQTPIDLDYLWGRVLEGDKRFDFLDFEYADDLEGTATTTEELIGMRLAFYNTGTGRAEADATGGDLETSMPGYHIEVTECWDAALDRTYLDKTMVSDDPESDEAPVTWYTEGQADSCSMSSLDDVPNLDDVSDEMLATLDQLATDGIPQ